MPKLPNKQNRTKQKKPKQKKHQQQQTNEHLFIEMIQRTFTKQNKINKLFVKMRPS